MTEPDTAAIRAALAREWTPENLRGMIRDLCDAVDAARAERDDYKASAIEFDKAWAESKARAEAAEARIAELTEKCVTDDRFRTEALAANFVLETAHRATQTSLQRAEARIAAALAVCEYPVSHASAVVLAGDVIRALTEVPK